MEKLDIILPVHNRLDLTARCIEALYLNTFNPFRLTVVDDVSTDLTPEYIKSLPHDVQYVRQPEKVLKGNQNIRLGLENTTSEIVGFLANSTVVEPVWDRYGLQYIQNNFDCGLVGFKLLYGTGTIEHAGMTFTEDMIPQNYGMHQAGHRQTHIREVDAVGFALVLFRREAILESMDDDMYTGFGFEDCDIGLTMRKKGWTVVYCGFGSAYHTAMATREGRELRTTYWENFEIFKNKWKIDDEARTD